MNTYTIKEAFDIIVSRFDLLIPDEVTTLAELCNSGTCSNCKYYYIGCCDRLEIDDPDYPYNNSKGAGLECSALDDNDLHIDLRVDPDFGCNRFEKRESDG